MKKMYAWAMYDWANSAFALIVMAGFFPILLKSYWSNGMSVNESSFWLGMGSAMIAVIVALISPLLGAFADRTGAKKRMLLFLTGMGVVMTAALYFVAKGQWQWGISIYIVASIAHSASKTFYNALILNVADSKQLARVSTLGYAMGYVGGGLLLAFIAWMIMRPDVFGFAHKTEVIRLSFFLVALWWAVFSLPILLFVDEEANVTSSEDTQEKNVWHALGQQFIRICKVRMLWLFLLAYWFYIGAVGTVSRMGVDYGLALGFTSGTMIVALLVSQLVAFPAALLFGWLGTRYRERPCILVCIFIYAIVCFALYKVETTTEFYLLAGLIGSVLGGVQALSRSLYAHIIPKTESAGMFGFYNTVTRLSGILGPAMMGLASLLSGNARLSIFSVLILLVVGGILLALMPSPEDKVDNVGLHSS